MNPTICGIAMNNQGLEALAALASAAPSSSTNRSGDTSNRSGSGGSREASGSAASTGNESASSSREAGGQATQPSDQTSASSQLPPWQQIMALAAASGGNGNPLGSNPASNLSLLQGMNSGAHQDNSSLMMAMQNMAQYQLMAQAQAQAASQNQLSALSNLAMQLSRTNPQANGLGLPLQNPFASLLKGKLDESGVAVCGIKRPAFISSESLSSLRIGFRMTNMKVALLFLYA